jgi:PhnB protein
LSVLAAIPYLVLRGQADDAITLYHHALGAEVVDIRRFGDLPMPCPEALTDRVAHAELRVGQATIMLTDGPEDSSGNQPGTASVNLMLGSPEAADTAFARLAEGGSVMMAMHDAPWGMRFGAVVDRFGVSWMVNGVGVTAHTH